MKVGDKGLALLKGFEGWRVEPVFDPVFLVESKNTIHEFSGV